MKKVLIALTLVLALSSMALAAETKMSGKVWFNVDDLLAKTLTTSNGYRLQFDSTVSEKSGARIRFENDTTTGAPVALKRAYWFTNTEFGKLLVGKQVEDFSMLSNNYAAENLNHGFTGVALYPQLGENISAIGWYDIAGKKVGAQGKYTADFGVIYGGISKAEADTDAAMAIGASIPVVKDQLTVFGQYDMKGDTREQFVGAKANLGVDLTAEYKIQAKEISLNATKKLGDVELSATYTKPDAGDGSLELASTVYF
ncbi:MAG: porin [Bacillota bacterium]|nr:porin [Bacillota bacterium]